MSDAAAWDAFRSALRDDDPADLYETAPCGYVSTLADGTIVKANGTFFRWTGYAADDLVGRRRLQDLFARGDRIFYETHYAPMLRMQGHAREIAVELVLSDGSRLPVLANSVTIEGDGETAIVRTVLFDARERRAYERELVAARRRAEEAEARASALARTLQSTLLPPTRVVIPGLEVAGMYRPAGDGSQVGGDFYDVFETGRGTHSIVLGDVCGKGAAAATVTALVRHTVRAESLHNSSPAKVVRLVHDAMLMYQPDTFCTLVLAELRVRSAEVEGVIAIGGHQRPVRTDGRTTEWLGRSGSIVGMIHEQRAVDVPFRLHAADVMVLYTDGLAEARSGSEFFGDGRVAQECRDRAHLEPARIASDLVETVVAFQDGAMRDDVAIVVVKVPPAESSAR